MSTQVSTTAEKTCRRRGQPYEVTNVGCPDCGHVMLVHPAPGNDLAECVLCQLTAGPVIPLPSVHLLDLKPGDRLAVILPEGDHTPRDIRDFQKRMQVLLDAYAPEMRAIVFPPGTRLDVARPAEEST